jgi:hypothetical protein
MSPTSGPYRLIGLVGRAGAGKDSCADALVQGREFARLAFADAVRIEIARSFGIDSRMLSTRHTKELPSLALAVGRCDDGQFINLIASLGHSVSAPRSPRQILRWWGTEYRRNMCGENYWTLRAHEGTEILHSRGLRRIVITDVRFNNEARMIRELGGELWRIRRREADQVRAAHASESELSAIVCHREIHNDSSLDALARKVLQAYQQCQTETL